MSDRRRRPGVPRTPARSSAWPPARSCPARWAPSARHATRARRGPPRPPAVQPWPVPCAHRPRRRAGRPSRPRSGPPRATRTPPPRRRRDQEAVGHLDQDSGAVARLDLGPGRAAVRQSLEHGEAASDDLVVRAPVQVCHHAHTTGVMLICRVVEASGHRRPSETVRSERGARDDAGPKVEEPGYTTVHRGLTPWRAGCSSSGAGSSASPARGACHAIGHEVTRGDRPRARPQRRVVGGGRHVGPGHRGPFRRVGAHEPAPRGLPPLALLRRGARTESGRELGYVTTGTVTVALDASDRAALDDLFAYHQALGLESRRCSASECRQLVPALSPAIRGGIEVPGDHQVDNRALLVALVAACARGGVTFVGLQAPSSCVGGRRLRARPGGRPPPRRGPRRPGGRHRNAQYRRARDDRGARGTPHQGPHPAARCPGWRRRSPSRSHGARARARTLGLSGAAPGRLGRRGSDGRRAWRRHDGAGGRGARTALRRTRHSPGRRRAPVARGRRGPPPGHRGQHAADRLDGRRRRAGRDRALPQWHLAGTAHRCCRRRPGRRGAGRCRRLTA